PRGAFMGLLWPSGIATENIIYSGNHRKTIQTYFMVLAAELLRCGVLIRAPQRTIEPLNKKGAAHWTLLQF
ncbi:hypothetical protein LJC56_11820, partial [Christensenellaceae bacterium OttesenSCG-928-K19]|nr:hypothetical protein [Christensenellaceae bacterium OttesenSCG-928-K19]